MENKKQYILIMAGGVGSRFWPMSKEERPKQFLSFPGFSDTFIGMTFKRASKIVAVERIFVLTHEKYQKQVSEHLPDLAIQNIICEPARRNTAAAILLGCLKIQAHDPDASVLVLPSDHVIEDEEGFVKAMKRGLQFVAGKEALLTLGMNVQWPTTGYGYIHKGKRAEEGIYQVDRFAEKPDKEMAIKYMKSGQYLWNAGIFLFSVPCMLAEFQKYAPKHMEILGGYKEYNLAGEGEFLATHYPTVPNISIDYAIMENSDQIYTMALDIGWTDLGTWRSLYDFMKKEGEENVLLAGAGNIHSEDSLGNLVLNDHNDKLIVLGGLEEYIIVDCDDALLIWPKEKEQEIKQLKNRVLKGLKSNNH